MDDEETTWDHGPWIVEAKITYTVSGVGSETATRAIRSLLMGSEMPHGERWPEFELMNFTTSVYPANAEPFDPDSFREDVA